MRNLLLSSLCAFCFFQSNAQNYSYSFEGNLSTEQIVELEKSINALNGIEYCKIAVKSEMNGEVFLYIASKSRENESEFSAADVKNILHQFNLTPKEFIETK